VIPADLPQQTIAEVRRLAVEAFRAIDGAGLARVDFLMDGEAGTIYLNEINTLPGFTNISMYSKMWDASGVAYSALVDRLIQLGLERHADKQKLKTSAL
jgi:D-alanine-D-alanine ligase